VVWDGAVARPDLLLNTDWAVVKGGDEVQTLIDKARLHGPRYELRQRITAEGALVIEIYHLEIKPLEIKPLEIKPRQITSLNP
jgi:hypothetical protein